MRKLLKKSIACILAAILCATLCVCAVTASADAALAYSTTPVSAAAGEQFTVDFSISNFINVKGALIDLSMPSAVASIDAITLNGGELAACDNENGNGFYIINGTSIKFLSLFGSEYGDMDSMETFTFNITATMAETVEEGTYDYPAPKFSITEDEKTLVDVTGSFGAFEVKAEVIEPSCKHEWEVVTATRATSTANGSITLACSKCEEEKTVDVLYNQYSRPSTCGLLVDSETLMRFGVRYERDLSRVGTITDGFISLAADENSVVPSKMVKYADCESASDGSYQAYLTTIGVPGKAYADNVTATAFSYDSVTDTWYSGTQLVYSVKSAAADLFASPKTTAAQKTMFVNLLNFGAKAQVFFNYNTENLANADIEAYQSFATEPNDYDAGGTQLIIPTDDAETWFVYQCGLLAESKIIGRLSFRVPKQYSGASTPIDVSNFKVVATYTNFNNETITQEFTAEQFGSITTNRYYVDVPLTSPDLRAMVSVTVYNGNVAVGPTTTVSAENIVVDLLAGNPDLAQREMLNACMAFSDAVNAFLSNK